MSDIAEKWGTRVAGRGFAQIPNYLLLLNQFLMEEKRLSPSELLLLLQLVGAWWRKDELPYPALKTLAVRAGVSDRQAQRAVSRLEEIGLLKRVKRPGSGMIASNAYDLAPLARFLDEVAKAFPNEFVRKPKTDQLQKLDASLLDGVAKSNVNEADAEKSASAPVRRRLRRPRQVKVTPRAGNLRESSDRSYPPEVE